MKILALVAAFLILPSSASTPSNGKDDPSRGTLYLKFGVYQTDKATLMYKRFTPWLEALQDDVSKRISAPCDIELAIFKSYDDGIDALVNGTVDFVHFGPASYITAKERNADIELLAMEHEKGEKISKGVIIVRKDSPYQTLEDLRGKSFAFGDKNSTVGRYLVQAELVNNNLYAIDLPGSKYLERHDQVASAVEHGDFEAGSVKLTTFNKANEKNTLRALAMFDNVTKPVAARAHMDRAVFQALQASILDFKDETFCKEMKITGFTTASDEDFKLVRDGIKKANQFESKSRGR